MVDHLKHQLEAWGPRARIAYARWAPTSAAVQNLVQGQVQGVQTITRSGAGAYQIVLKDKCKDLVAIVSVVENDTTLYHFARVESQDAVAGTVNISHKSVAFAGVASGPASTDTVDQLTVLIIQRMFD
jgi:hypothetical protein